MSAVADEICFMRAVDIDAGGNGSPPKADRLGESASQRACDIGFRPMREEYDPEMGHTNNVTDKASGRQERNE